MARVPLNQTYYKGSLDGGIEIDALIGGDTIVEVAVTTAEIMGLWTTRKEIIAAPAVDTDILIVKSVIVRKTGSGYALGSSDAGVLIPRRPGFTLAYSNESGPNNYTDATRRDPETYEYEIWSETPNALFPADDRAHVSYHGGGGRYGLLSPGDPFQFLISYYQYDADVDPTQSDWETLFPNIGTAGLTFTIQYETYTP